MVHGRSAILDLAESYEACNNCPALCETRSNVVFGSGSTTADIVIVGEAPGVEEDATAEPFIGKSGKLLMDLLRLAWPKTDEIEKINKISDDERFFRELRNYLDDHIFWTNTVCCWSGEGNRTPTPKEIKACSDRLNNTIYAIDPMLVIAAGKTAATALLGKKVGVIEKRGTIYDITIKSPVTGREVRYPMMVILHPSALLRKGDQALLDKGQGDTYLTSEDLKYALELVNTEYQDIFGSEFPFKPEEYRK